MQGWWDIITADKYRTKGNKVYTKRPTRQMVPSSHTSHGSVWHLSSVNASHIVGSEVTSFIAKMCRVTLCAFSIDVNKPSRWRVYLERDGKGAKRIKWEPFCQLLPSQLQRLLIDSTRHGLTSQPVLTPKLRPMCWPRGHKQSSQSHSDLALYSGVYTTLEKDGFPLQKARIYLSSRECSNSCATLQLCSDVESAYNAG